MWTPSLSLPVPIGSVCTTRRWRRPENSHPRTEPTAHPPIPNAAPCTQQHSERVCNLDAYRQVIFGLCAKSVRSSGPTGQKTFWLAGAPSWEPPAAADINSRCSCKGSTGFCPLDYCSFSFSLSLPRSLSFCFTKPQQVQSAEGCSYKRDNSCVAANNFRWGTCGLGKVRRCFVLAD